MEQSTAIALEPENEPPARHRVPARWLVPLVVAIVVALIAALIAGGTTRHTSPDAASPKPASRKAATREVVVLGRPAGSEFEMVVLRRGEDPADGVVVSRGGTGRGVIDLRRSLARDLSGGVALGGRIASIDDHRVAYSVEEGETRSLVLVDFERHDAQRLYAGSSEALFYSDVESGWLMVYDMTEDGGATCARIRPASRVTEVGEVQRRRRVLVRARGSRRHR